MLLTWPEDIKVSCPYNVYWTFVLNDVSLGECISCTICPFDSTMSLKEVARSQNIRSPMLRAFGQLLGRYVRCRLYAVPSLRTYSVVSPVFFYFFKVVRFVELIWDRTHQAPSSKGRIVQGTNRPRDESSKGRIVQWVNRSRYESSDGRMVQTIMDKTSVGDELKLHQSQRRVLITAFSFEHILYIYNTDWAISHVLIFM